MHPIVADGGELTVLRSLAAYSYGRWSVEWQDSVPEEIRPSLPDERDFGYTSRLQDEPGRMGRRFVQSDISIQAAEYDSDGERIPDTGASDAEQVLDAAASRTSGDVFFGREFTREHLGGLVPWVDFQVGDLVPVLHWGKTISSVVTSIEAVTDHGAIVDWRVRVGDTLLRDDEARESSLRQLERDMAQEVRERKADTSSVRSYADSAVAVERTERVADVAQVREVLGGAQADESDLLAQLAAVQVQITGMVDDGETPPPPGLLNSYLWMNAQLWEAQREIDEAQDQLAEQQNARQNEQGAIMDAMQAQLGRMGDRSWQVGTDGDGVWRVDGSTVQALGSWVGTAVLDVTRRVRDGNTDVTVRTYPREVRRVDVGTTRSWEMKSDVHAGVFYYQRAGGSLTRLDQRLPRFVADTWWTPVRTVTVEKDRLVSMELRVDWAAANRGSLYGVRITVDGQTVAEESSTSVGPLGLWGNGARSQSVSRNIDIKAGQTVRFEARCNHAGEVQRTASGGNTRLWWMEG